jgi:hypothetical protein
MLLAQASYRKEPPLPIINSYGLAEFELHFDISTYAGSAPLQVTEDGLIHIAIVKLPVIFNAGLCGIVTNWPLLKLIALEALPLEKVGVVTAGLVKARVPV